MSVSARLSAPLIWIVVDSEILSSVPVALIKMVIPVYCSYAPSEFVVTCRLSRRLKYTVITSLLNDSRDAKKDCPTVLLGDIGSMEIFIGMKFVAARVGYCSANIVYA